MTYLKSTSNKRLIAKCELTMLALILAAITLATVSCDTTEPSNNEKLYIELAEVSCTESWLKVETSEVNLPVELKLYRDNTLAQEITVKEKSTVIYDSLLSPSQSYKYQAKLPGVTSQEINITTLDTTSHNFNWQTFTFGEHASSALYDVAIIDENNIYAVGEIYLNDSTGKPDPQPYSLAKWDGKKWELKKLFYNSNSIITFIRGILVLNQNNIWLAAGSIFHWDGVSSEADLSFSRLTLPKPDATIEKLWGTENFIYGVGNAGTIVYYINGRWQKIESGTELPIQDIWGINNEETNDNEIMCVASDKYYGGGPELFRISNNSIVPLPINGLPWSLSSIWFKSKYKAYIVGDGIFVKNYPNEQWENITGYIASFYSHSVRGNDLNDVVIAGSGGEVIHFNGSTWQNYNDKGLPSFYGNYYSITIKGNVICAVGQATLDKNKATIALGFRWK